MSEFKGKLMDKTLVSPPLKIYLPELLEEQVDDQARLGKADAKSNPTSEKEKIVLRLIEHLTNEL
jgi:hypothetical protein